MNKAILALSAASAFVLSGPAMAADLITNGGFETGNFSGWTVTNPSGTAPVVIQYNQSSSYPTGAFNESVPPPAGGGTHGAYFSSDTSNPDSIAQSVSVVAGSLYTISFNYYVPLNGYNNPNDATLALFLGGVQSGATLTAGSLGGVVPQTWGTFTTTYTAGATGNVNLALRFTGLGSTATDFLVDNVSMNAVPEPATWAMLIAGFAVAGASLRRRRTSVSFA